jgi:hypothetical protein
MKKSLSFLVVLLLLSILAACGEATATVPATTSIATGGITTPLPGPPVTTTTLTTSNTSTRPPIPTPTPIKAVLTPTPFADLQCIDVSKDMNFRFLKVGTYGCAEAVVRNVFVDPLANGNRIYGQEVAVSLSLFVGFELGFDGVVLKNSVGKFDVKALTELKGHKIKVRGQVINVPNPGTSMVVYGILLENIDQIQDLGNQP